MQTVYNLHSFIRHIYILLLKRHKIKKYNDIIKNFELF
jgi:hypothetical protein